MTPIVAAAAAERKAAIEGASDELNAIAMENLDSAPARRRVRDAFADAQRNLDHFLFKEAPTGIQVREEFDGALDILEKLVAGAGVAIKAALFFCHGYGDTCTFFFEGVAKRISAAGYAVYAMDYPGFGLSQGLHGYIPSFDQMVDHVIEQFALIRVDQVLMTAADVTPPGPVLNMLTLMLYILPEAKLFPQKDIIADMAFRDLQKRKMAEFNVISYADQMRLRTAVELIKATRDIELQLDKVSSPLLILHGAADKVTDPKVSKYLYDKASSTEDKTIKLYEESYHNILVGRTG